MGEVVPGLVSAVVVNWNGGEYLRACLSSLKAQTYPDLECVLVDNASTDGSADLVEREFPWVRVVRNARNRGYASAMNRGIREGRGEFILALNFDVVLAPEFVARLVEALRAFSRAGSASGRLYRADSPALLDSAGHEAYRPRLFRNRGYMEPDSPLFQVGTEVFGAPGAAALYRREMLEDVALDGEYFDEDLFAFFEDVDLDWRARLRGWTSVYVPEAVGWHERGGTGRRRNDLVEELNFANRVLVVMKNDSPSRLARNLPAFLLTLALKAAELALARPRVLARAAARILRLAPRILEKRRKVQAGRRVGERAVEIWFRPLPYRRYLRRQLARWGGRKGRRGARRPGRRSPE